MTRQAETGMIQPCSKDGDREGERNARRGGGGCGRMGTQSTWRGRLKGDEKEQGEWAAGEMIMMGILKKNWEFIIHSTKEFTWGVKGGMY